MPYYIQRDNGEELTHYGVKGMKWRNHKYKTKANLGDVLSGFFVPDQSKTVHENRTISETTKKAGRSIVDGIISSIRHRKSVPFGTGFHRLNVGDIVNNYKKLKIEKMQKQVEKYENSKKQG